MNHVVWMAIGVLAANAAAVPAENPPRAAGFRMLEPGLEWGVFEAPQPSTRGDSKIRVLRIDPTRFEVVLANASAPGEEGKTRTAREWSTAKDLVAAINASMFATDYRTSVSLMRTRDHVNNPRLSKDNAVLLFDPEGGKKGLPAARIADRTCDDFEALREQYRGQVQNIRMISCDRRNVWAPQKRYWSTALVGQDGKGRLLFIHARSPWSTHDLIDNLLGLPIDLVRAMYVEGGPEAQLYVKSGDFEEEHVGSYETGFFERDDNTRAWPVPNVLGITRKPK